MPSKILNATQLHQSLANSIGPKTIRSLRRWVRPVKDIQDRWDARKQRRSLQQEIKKCGFDRKKHKI